MKVTVCFDNLRVVVPCGDGTLLVRDLMHEAKLRYKKATGKSDSVLTITSLSSLTGGGIFDPDDRLCDVADDREQIIAHFIYNDVNHAGGDGASSVGTNSPDFFQQDYKGDRFGTDYSNISNNIKRESKKRSSMHILSSREPCLTTYSAQSLPRESRRKEPLGQDAKTSHELTGLPSNYNDQVEIHEIVIKNEAGPLGLHVVPCYDLSGNDQGLRVEGIEPHGRIARDGQIDLHDNIIKLNGHNLLRVPFSKVQEIFRTSMSDPCLKITISRQKKHNNKELKDERFGNASCESEGRKSESDENVKRLQGTNYNILQTANTRKIGKMIDIELTKGSNGLGFSVTTRDNPAGGHCPIYIKNILPKGAAVEDGRLKSGDRLLEVNNVEMSGKSQDEVVALLRSIAPGGKVKLLVSRQEEVAANVSDSQLRVAPNNDSCESSRSWNIYRSSTKRNEVRELKSNDTENLTLKPVQVSEDIVLSPRKNRMILTLDIPVYDSEKAGLGVSVKGKTSNNDDNTNVDLGIFIKSVLHGGAASRDGRLRTNDQLLNVNGVSLLGLSNSEAMETLRRAMLNSNSPVTGVISLTIARRVSSYDSSNKNFNENLSSLGKLDSINTMFTGHLSKRSDRRLKERSENLNTDYLDNNNTSSSTPATPWNPVIDRLTEQYNKNTLRNESYCIATNKAWIDSTSSLNSKISSKQNNNRVESVIEDFNNDRIYSDDVKRITDDKNSQYSSDPTYDSQLSLDEFNCSTNKFSRDAIGRQSMSEKRHAALDAKNTDTYKRNKKLRESRENKNPEGKVYNDVCEKGGSEVDNYGRIGGEKTGGISIDGIRRHFEEKSVDQTQSEYSYTIPGCKSEVVKPRKHWLVDDINHGGELSNCNDYKDQKVGFSNSRGDIKQASLNSSLDERYKRSKKKGGIRSMLRLGKNRKSLNFGDNSDNRNEANNYCSGTINYIT